MSFSFRATKGGEEWSPDFSRRRLTNVELFHTTILTGHEPAYHGTSRRLQVRTLAEQLHASTDEAQEIYDAILEGRLTPEQVQRLAAFAKVGDAPTHEPATSDEPAPRTLDEWKASSAAKARQ